jgi:replication fork protection complex subunit Tof1/Swi1
VDSTQASNPAGKSSAEKAKGVTEEAEVDDDDDDMPVATTARARPRARGGFIVESSDEE